MRRPARLPAVGRTIAVGVALAILTQGCAATLRPEPVASEPERRAYAAAVSMIAADPDEAARAFQDFLREWPRSPLADDAAERLAALAMDAGDDDEAVRWLYYVVRNHQEADRAEAARLALAEVEKQRGNRVEARRALSRLRVKRLPVASRPVAFRLLADLAEDPAERLRWLAELHRATLREDGSSDAEGEFEAALVAASADDLSRLAPQLGSRPPAARVYLRLAELSLAAGDFERADAMLGRAARLELGDRQRADLERLRLRVERRERIAGSGELLPTFEQAASQPPPATEGAVGTLGVVLPLTGPFAAYGEESLRGILLAARIFERQREAEAAESVDAPPIRPPAPPGLGGLRFEQRDDEPRGVRLVVRDSAGDPERAREAVRELGARHDVVAVIGPLLARSAEAAASAAEDEGVPLLTLTSREEVTRDRDNVFRLRTTPGDQVSFLADWATEQDGAQRFAILYPRDSYGRGMRDRFWAAVEERGGYVVGVGSYDAEATDFAGPIRRMIGYELLTSAERKALDEREELLRKARRLDPAEAAEVREVVYSLLGPEKEPLPPIVDFDALFIPDNHEKAALIATQLAFHEIKGVRLLGSDGWAHPDLVRIGRRHVSGAVISALFHSESRFEYVTRFVDDYADSFDAEPDVFAAHGFDAANLALTQLADGRTSRRDLRNGILRTRGFPGVSGVITILSDGNARKRPFLLQVTRGQIRSID